MAGVQGPARWKRILTNLAEWSWVISGSVPLNSSIARRITGHPLPRCSMKPLFTMKLAISSFRDRGCPPAGTLSVLMWLGSVPGLVTST